MMLISVEKVLVSSIAENGQKSIGDTHAIPQKVNYRDTRCDTEKSSKKYRRYQVLRYFIAILTALPYSHKTQAHKSFQKQREDQGKRCEGLRVSIRLSVVIRQKFHLPSSFTNLQSRDIIISSFIFVQDAITHLIT